MNSAFDKHKIEKLIQLKLGKPMEKGAYTMYVSYLNSRHIECLENGKEDEAEKYFKLIKVLEENYKKFQKPFEIDEKKQIDYINK
ncbi:MAG: hypothetical protein M0R03_21960 [Novosphingobium sp.]|nr:hypothetical protein [Novosphingobium sp.]